MAPRRTCPLNWLAAVVLLREVARSELPLDRRSCCLRSETSEPPNKTQGTTRLKITRGWLGTRPSQACLCCFSLPSPRGAELRKTESDLPTVPCHPRAVSHALSVSSPLGSRAPAGCGGRAVSALGNPGCPDSLFSSAPLHL